MNYDNLNLKVVDITSAAPRIVVGIKPITGLPITIKVKKSYFFGCYLWNLPACLRKVWVVTYIK